ncbi:HET-domain-containing protein, partial [Polyplosphaeria fusca]
MIGLSRNSPWVIIPWYNREQPNIEVFALDTSDETLPQLGCEVPNRPDSQMSFEFLKTSYNSCRENHPKCRQSLAVLPKRVIDISTTPLRLVEPTSGTRGTYAALSYRWGGWKSFTTTKTFDSLKKEIAYESMPAVFQDFIRVARELSIDYIWIDSVCIIQDDMDDWAEEATKMAEIYENASIVVAASSAPNPGASFLRNWTYSPLPAIPLNLAESGSKFIARGKLNCGFHASTRSHEEEIDLLDSRGWTLQEKVLARRWISYSASELQWKCRTLASCQCQKLSWVPESFLVDSETSEHNQHAKWQLMIDEYTT